MRLWSAGAIDYIQEAARNAAMWDLLRLSALMM